MDCGSGIPNITQAVSLNITNSSVTQYLVTKFFLHDPCSVNHKTEKASHCVSKGSKLQVQFFLTHFFLVTRPSSSLDGTSWILGWFQARPRRKNLLGIMSQQKQATSKLLRTSWPRRLLHYKTNTLICLTLCVWQHSMQYTNPSPYITVPHEHKVVTKPTEKLSFKASNPCGR
jgi:hypothetical protein